MSKDEYITELEMETFDLIAKITTVLKDHDLWNEDGTFTFRDGDRWARFDPETEFKYEEYTKEENEDYG
jgi:hypothetical protein